MANEQAVSKLREEARKLLATEGPAAWALRSCWECNSSHEHLKESPHVISCFMCGRWFYKGVDITEYEEETEQEADTSAASC